MSKLHIVLLLAGLTGAAFAARSILFGPWVVSHLIVKYLFRRWIAWVALAAVMLCTTMVVVVISVMGGWLDMFEQSARGLTGDVVVKGSSLSGFPYYEEMIERIENDRDVVAAAPTLSTYGVINIQNLKTDAVRVMGLPLEKIGKVNNFPKSLYRQHQRYLDDGQTPPDVKTWGEHEQTRIPLDELPADVPFDRATQQILAGDPSVDGRVGYIRGFGLLTVRGRLTDAERDRLAALSGDKAWRDAVRRLARESNWPGIIPASGVLNIRKGASGKMEGRGANLYDYWAKLTVIGIGTDQSFDEKSKAERQYWINDDSRTGMWQYDTTTVYVPFDILQTDLGMTAREVTRMLTVFTADSPQPQKVLGLAREDGRYSLFRGRSAAASETVEVKQGEELGFRRAADGTVTAVAGKETFDLGTGRVDADWRVNRSEIEPARTTEIHIKLKDGISLAGLNAARDRIDKIVGDIMAARQPGLFPDQQPRVETWEEASSLFIGAIKKEKLLVTMLFGIMSLVAIFLIFCIFYMIVAEKTKDIGIIKSVGATSADVSGIFLGYGLVIGIIGAALGLLVSYLIVHNINEIHDWMGRRLGLVVWNPEVYAFDKIPNQMNPGEVTVIVAIAVLASVVGALIPAFRAARMHPVEALRWE